MASMATISLPMIALMNGRGYFPLYQNQWGSMFGLVQVQQLPVFGPLEAGWLEGALGKKPEKCTACRGALGLAGFDNALSCETCCDGGALCGDCARGHECPRRRSDWASDLRLDWMLPGLRPEERWNAFRLVKLAMFPTEAEFLQFGDDEKQQRDSCMATVAIRCRDDMPPGCPFPTALVIPSPLAAAITRRGIQQPRGF